MTVEAREFILAHAYDAAKRREYYLRTRKLVGRKPAQIINAGSPKGGPAPSNAAKRKAERERVLKAVQARLKVLQKELERLVALSKEETGAETPSTKKTSPASSKSPERKLTTKQKKESAERSAEYREKNKQKSETAESVQAQIAKVREQIAELKAQIAAAKKQQPRRVQGASAEAKPLPSASGR